MKKKHLSLSKKLMLQKEAILELNKNQQALVAGGTPRSLVNCNTWDPMAGCETRVPRTQVCR
ncbi:class I lanthipeptide [Chitinophaga nivalis]|uniref:Class I lanthipeptide n=1 Tax=Chitinophaga nivalis TaxID=2991709 RepID=A0ABT3IJH3_9BACT|nr:class I lanthipeptide [Chitinophaga nivalis]MCW3466211.1 class I lanthipeptide [Chitinophaga nivalis]MCW3484098.1 class I lanthipeptide [Chitinophaga nivalis]